MNGSLPPQEGSDPKLSSIMVGPSESEATTTSGLAVARGISHRRLGKSQARASASDAAKPSRPPQVEKDCDAAKPSCPPQVGKDPKLLACMDGTGEAAIAGDAAKPSCPPQVGTDPKLLVCMDGTGEAAIAAAAAQTSNPVPLRNDGVTPPSQESVATSLLSFKQTSPVLMSKNSAFTAAKAPPDAVSNNAPSGWWQQDEEERFL